MYICVISNYLLQVHITDHIVLGKRKRKKKKRKKKGKESKERMGTKMELYK